MINVAPPFIERFRFPLKKALSFNAKGLFFARSTLNQRSTNAQQPTTNNQQPTTNNQRSTTNNQRSTATVDGQESTANKRQSQDVPTSTSSAFSRRDRKKRQSPSALRRRGFSR
ncbi:MAG: hypothetical protein IKW13_02145 [Thermoguttaceae bacterium]|nr:hypothetical protein [Thermoguttaceae bacterium]